MKTTHIFATVVAILMVSMSGHTYAESRKTDASVSGHVIEAKTGEQLPYVTVMKMCIRDRHQHLRGRLPMPLWPWKRWNAFPRVEKEVLGFGHQRERRPCQRHGSDRLRRPVSYTHLRWLTGTLRAMPREARTADTASWDGCRWQTRQS